MGRGQQVAGRNGTVLGRRRAWAWTAGAAVVLAAATLLLSAAPLPVAASVPSVATPPRLAAARPDSADLVKKARDAQRDFEFFRQSRIPVQPERRDGSCDAQIGRICIWFGGDEEEHFPPELPEVGQARSRLIGLLATTNRDVADSWVIGQLVHYLVEAGNVRGAEEAARACGLAETWWCDALLGYALHVRADFTGAEEAFRRALEAMPAEEQARWGGLHYVISRDDEKEFEKLPPDERQRRWELFWKLSDPLFVVRGNDRFTDHFARLVVARNRRDAENPQGMFWEDDLEETLVRYGRIRGWSRTHAPARTMGGLGRTLQDTRRVVGHHAPKSRGYLFPFRYLESPSDIPPESWITAPRESRTWYSPPYAPDFRGLETQVGRFRRDEAMLVVGAYRPAGGDPPQGEVHSAFFLIPVDGGEEARVAAEGAEGVVTLIAPPGRYVSSLEVWDAQTLRAWRARQGVKQTPLVPGLVAVSDLLLLREGASLPVSLEEALPDVRRGVRVRQGERFVMVWEVYGLDIDQPARVTVGFTQGRPGFLERVGDFLGLIEPDEPVEITFADPGPDGVQSAFRAVALELPDLEPGAYTLHLRIDLPGREPSIASRPIVVEGAPQP